MPNKKLLITTSTFPRWRGDSTPPFITELALRLGERFGVFVLAPHSSGAQVSEHFGNIAVRRYKYFFPPTWQRLSENAILPMLKKNPALWAQVPLLLMGQFIALMRIVKKHRITLVHAHWTIPQGLVAVLYKKLFNPGVQVLITSHGSDINALGFWPLTLLNRWIIDNADGVTAVSRSLRQKALSLGAKKEIRVIPMGVDFSLFSPDKYDEDIKRKYDVKGPLLLFVGRLTESKGVQHLIKAMPAVLRDFPEARLLIVGNGEMKSELEELAASLGLSSGTAIFTGPIRNDRLPGYYATADIFVGPSLSEGLGLVFVEAIASGTFAIGTDLPAISDVIKEGRTGFIVSRNDPDQIAEKIKYVLSNQGSLHEMKETARNELRERFDWPAVSEKYARMIDALLLRDPAERP